MKKWEYKQQMNHVDYYKELFDNAFEPILLIEGHNFIDGNKAALDILEMQSKDELTVVHPSQLSPQYQPDGQLSLDKANEMINTCYEKGYHQFEWLHKTLNDKEFLVEVTLKLITIDDKTLMHTTWREIEKEKEFQANIDKQSALLEEKNQLITDVKKLINTDDEGKLFDKLNLFEEYKRALDESSIVSKTDIHGTITYVNDKFCEISGYSKEELLGANHRIVKHPDMSKEFFEKMWATISAKKPFHAVIKNRAKNQKAYYVDSTIMPVLDQDDTIIEYISVRNDITKIYEQDKLIHEQYTDTLTGLPNRVRLLRDIENSIFPKLAIFNIDRFKDINESYSLEIGDKILLEFGNKLQAYDTTNIHTYRIAGDVFALFASGNVKLEDLSDICDEFVEDLEQNSFIIENTELDISVTVGIAAGRDKLLNHAEIAHLYAKRHNKMIARFDENLPIYQKLLKSIDITKNIRTAIKNNKIVPFGQKILCNGCDDIKQEVLMRLQLESGEYITPYFFLEQAKKAKLYPQLSRAIIKKACEHFANTKQEFSINLMLDDIKNEKTIDFLFNTLKETKTNKQITLEIVESEGIEQYQEVEKFIKKAKRYGCKIAIDDFGTGYSNFEYLIRLNIDILKIDGSLIKNIHIDKNTYLTVKTIVDFAKHLKIQVVAEFVHSQEVQEIIEELGIEFSQGFLFHEPQILV